ncbi:MAG TPA: type II secretion system F family protein [Terriglobia bacterium]|nr:type II secretion system F family protein [Terriglobia bacterium]
MAIFRYKAVNAQGAFSEGQVDARDTPTVVHRLRNMGLIPVSIEEPPRQQTALLPKLHLQRVSKRDILFFTEELSTLVRAGLPLDRSLTIAAELASKAALRNVINDVLKQIKGGKSLAEALAEHPKHFSRLYVNMIRAGEAGGILDVILGRLVEFERSADELRSYMIAALIYPSLLTAVGMVSIGILLYFVIPKFAGIFEEMGAAIPPATMAMLWLSKVTRSYWWIALGGIAALVLAVRFWLRTPTGSRTWDIIKLKLPLLGSTVLKMEIARFSRTLGTLLASSVPLIAGVRIVQDIAHNQIIAEGISKIADGAKRGEGVSRPMREAGVFPGLAVHLVEVGEETGKLDAMLLQVADVYEKDVKTSIKALTSVFEPAIILVMGILVGTVVLSMLMAIFSINEIGF